MELNELLDKYLNSKNFDADSEIFRLASILETQDIEEELKALLLSKNLD